MFAPRCSTAQSATRPTGSAAPKPAPISFDTLEPAAAPTLGVTLGVTGGKNTSNQCCISFIVALVLSGAVGGFLSNIAPKGCFGIEECQARFPGVKWNCSGPVSTWSGIGSANAGRATVLASDFPNALNESLTDAGILSVDYDMVQIYPVGHVLDSNYNLTLPKDWTSVCEQTDIESDQIGNITMAIAYSAALVSDLSHPISELANWTDLYSNYVDFKDYFCTPNLQCGFFAADLPGTELFSNASFYD